MKKRSTRRLPALAAALILTAGVCLGAALAAEDPLDPFDPFPADPGEQEILLDDGTPRAAAAMLRAIVRGEREYTPAGAASVLKKAAAGPASGSDLPDDPSSGSDT